MTTLSCINVRDQRPSTPTLFDGDQKINKLSVKFILNGNPRGQESEEIYLGIYPRLIRCRADAESAV